MWNLVRDDLADVRKALRGCRDMEGWEAQCQLVLLANSGIDLKEFLAYLAHGLACLTGWAPTLHPTGLYFEATLTRVRRILDEVSLDPAVTEDSGLREAIDQLGSHIISLQGTR